MEMTHTQKLICFVMFYMSELQDKGLMSGRIQITDKGIAAAMELIASGFKPTDDERNSCLAFLSAHHGFSLTDIGKATRHQLMN